MIELLQLLLAKLPRLFWLIVSSLLTAGEGLYVMEMLLQGRHACTILQDCSLGGKQKGPL